MVILVIRSQIKYNNKSIAQWSLDAVGLTFRRQLISQFHRGTAMRKLRGGSTDFESYRKFGDYYADKTKFLYQLVSRPDPFFLSRPGRFGKSLLVSTLKYILQV
jgi:hypothetical protein